jgi:copper chaperone CopZ
MVNHFAKAVLGPPMTTRTYTVEWMACGHCAHAIAAHVGALPGRFDVDIDVNRQQVTLVGEDADEELVLAAIDRAGYEVSSHLAAVARGTHAGEDDR